MTSTNLSNCQLLKLFTIDNIIKILLELEKENELTVREIGRKIKVNYTLSRQVELLTQHGLIKKGEPGTNKVIKIQLTPKGREFLHTLKSTYNTLEELDSKYS